MRRPPAFVPAAFLVVFLAVFLVWPVGRALAAAFPRLPAGVSCVARANVDGREVELELRLLNDDLFILQTQVRHRGGSVLLASVSGSWRQSGDGAHLLLDNPYGLHRRAQIGGRGTVYLDMAPWPGAPSVLFVLEREALRVTPVRLMGVLHDGADGRLLLRESGSGLDLAVLGMPDGPGPRTPLFVELMARLRHDGLVVESLRAQSARIPSGLMARQPSFADVCGTAPWLLERQDPARPILCTFRAHGPREGSIVLAGAGLRAEARYRLGPESGIRFEPTEEEGRMLRLLDETDVLRLLEAVSWKTVGDSLAFRTAGGKTVYLVPRTARAPRRANLAP